MTVWAGFIMLGLGVGASIFLPVPQSLKTGFDAGQSLFALGEYEGAIMEYEKIVGFKSWAVRTDRVKVTIGAELELPVVDAAYYQLGNAYKRSGAHEKAIESFSKVLTAENVPGALRSLVRFQVAETRFLQLQYADAAREYKRFVELFPGSEYAGQAYYYAGWSEFHLKQYDQSVATLLAMLDAYPADRYAPDSRFRIASCHFEKGDYAGAIDESQAVLDSYPESPVIAQAVYLKAQAYDEMGSFQQAIASYREVRDLYHVMYALLRGSLREGKNVDFENYRELFETSSLRMAEIYCEQGEFEEAYKELIDAQETTDERFYKAKFQMRLGDTYILWGRFEDAWKAYDQVIELYGDTSYPPNAQYHKGEARFFGGQYAEARSAYLGVVERYPESETSLRSAALYSAGFASEKLTDRDGALALYDRVVDDFPHSDEAPLCLLRIGRVNFELERVDEAVEAYQRIVEKYGATAHAADASYGLGIIYKERGRSDDAVAAFEQVGREAGEIYVAALVEAASIHMTGGRDERGRQLLSELLDGVQGDRDLEAMTHFHTARLQHDAENYRDAIHGYTKVIEEYPNSSVTGDAYFGRGLARHQGGEYTAALEDFTEFLDAGLPEATQRKVEYAMALSYAALGHDVRAIRLLHGVIDAADETLARDARRQLISMGDKQDPEDAIRTYEQMLLTLDDAADRAEVLIRLARAYLILKQYDRSIDASQQAIDLGIDAESISKAVYLQGLGHAGQGRSSDAIEAYASIVDNYPQTGAAQKAQFRMGVAYDQLSKGGKVDFILLKQQAFRAYYEKFPEDDDAPRARYYDAWSLYQLGKWRDAAETFSDLAANHPDSDFVPQSLFRAGEAIFNTAQGLALDHKVSIYEEALGRYEAVITHHSGSEFVDDALYNKAWVLINLDRKAEAVGVFEQIVVDYPDGRYGARSQYTLGDYYYREKEYDKATESYERFLEMYPQEELIEEDQELRGEATELLGHLAEIDAYAIYVEGEKLYDQKDFEGAIGIFRSVMEKYPDSDPSVSAAVNIGAAYMALERYRQAAEQFQKLVDLYNGIPRFSEQVDFCNSQLEMLVEARII